MAVIWLAAVPRPAIAAAQSQLDTAVLNRIKAATAYVVTTIPGQRETVTGSGFLIMDGGLLLTNAHVVEDFLAYNAAHRSQPAKLEVIVFNSPDEARIITANVVALSRNPTLLADGTVSHLNDLALLQADCESPMAFLELGPADGLVETQQIYAAG